MKLTWGSQRSCVASHNVDDGDDDGDGGGCDGCATDPMPLCRIAYVKRQQTNLHHSSVNFVSIYVSPFKSSDFCHFFWVRTREIERSFVVE